MVDDLRVTRSLGPGPTPWPLRLLAALLVVTQLVPAVAAHADEAPTPVVHAAHLSDAADPGCQPFHDELHCLACRILSTQPLTPTRALLPEAVTLSPLPIPATEPWPAGSDLLPTRQARAPPVS